VADRRCSAGPGTTHAGMDQEYTIGADEYVVTSSIGQASVVRRPTVLPWAVGTVRAALHRRPRVRVVAGDTGTAHDTDALSLGRSPTPSTPSKRDMSTDHSPRATHPDLGEGVRGR
jgi:hypothetical protein